MPTNYLTSLVSSWEFEELSGNFLDQVGTNPLVPSGVTQGATGIFGFCGSYDGVNDSASITDAAQVGLDAGTVSCTFEAWVKIQAQGSSHEILDKSSPLGTGPYYRMFVGATAATMAISDNGGANQKTATGATAIEDNAKHQLVGVIDRSANLVRIYVDGLQEGTADIAGVASLNNAESFFVGADAGVANFTNGLIDRARVWIGTAWSAAQVLELYNGGLGKTYIQLGGNQNGNAFRRRSKP